MENAGNNLETSLRNAVFLLKRHQARAEELEAALHEPIAIVGMSCRFPHQADTPAAFWKNLCDRVDAIREIPPERWDVDAYYDPKPLSPGKMNTRWGGFLDGIDRFDPEFFGISPREAARIDPQQRLLLEVAWEALTGAGMPPSRVAGASAGVYVGIIGNDYAYIQTQSGVPVDGFMGTGNAHSIAANRLSYVFDLHGPSVALDTACSSSLVAVHLACRSLRQGEVDFAIAGGVNLIMRPEMTVVLSQAQMLSPDGRCRTFDAGANGYVRGEGCGMVVLKRLRDAQADGDRILAVIRGSAVNQDGRSNGISAPSGPAQEMVIRAALADARVAPSDIDYVETHGTGTSLGDPIEVEALRNVLCEGRPASRPLALGAVKTNIGHLEGAAGIVALIKAVLALQHESIPPNLHLTAPNPKLPSTNGLIRFPAEMLPWVRGTRSRLAGVSSFGFGGTNAHIIVGEAPAQSARKERGVEERPRHVVALSARSPAALKELALRYQAFLDANPELPVADFAFSANTRSERFSARAAIVARTGAQLREGLGALVQEKTASLLRIGTAGDTGDRKVAFLFSGQGSQYARMGMSLYDTQPAFRDALNRCEEILRNQGAGSVLALLNAGDEAAEELRQTQNTQPALFALEYALAQMWMSWGVRPAAVMGHSFGEYVAACVAGVFSLEDGIRIVRERARLMQELPAGGCMAAVAAEPELLEPVIGGRTRRLSIAAFNGPRSCVISGAAADVEQVVAQLQAAKVKTQTLATSHAFHSPLMEPMLERFEHFMSGIRLSAPAIPLVSNLTGTMADPQMVTTPGYWRRHIREPVKFMAGIETLWARGCRAFLEIGPGTTLTGMGRQCVPRETESSWVSSLRKGRNDWETVLDALAALHVTGADIDWRAFDAPYARQSVDLPPHPFQRKRYWTGDEIARDSRADTAGGESVPTGYPLLGGRLRLALSGQDVFEARLTPDRPPLLRDHVIHNHVVMPGVAYIEQALAAARTLGDGDWMLEDLALLRPLVLREARPVAVQTVVTTERFGSAQFRIVSPAGDDDAHANFFSTHASGRLRLDMEAAKRALDGRIDLAGLRSRFGGEPYDDAWRSGLLQKSGMQMGPAFTWVVEHWRNDLEVLGHSRAPSGAKPADAFVFEPGMMDCGLQLLGSMLPGAGIDAHVPVSIRRVTVFRPPAGDVWYHARVTATHGTVADGDVTIYSADGDPLAVLEGVSLQRVTGEWIRAALGEREPQWLYHLQWQGVAAPVEVPATADNSSTWLLFDDERGTGSAVAGILRERGDAVEVVAAAATPEEVCERVHAATGEKPVAGIVHCSSLDAGPAGGCAPADLGLARDRAWGRTLDIVQALTSAPASKPPRVLLVTRGAQSLEGDTAGAPVQAPLWGLARVIAAEHPEIACRRIDLDPAEGGTPDESRDAQLLVRELLGADREDQVAYRAGRRHVARLAVVDGGATAKLPVPETESYRLEITSRGELENVRLAPVPRRSPGPGEIELRVTATGLNFRDVLNVLGLYPGDPGPLGGECTGVVTALGEGVQGLAVGDTVFGLVPASFASHAVTSARFVAPKPSALTDAQAATLPIAFLTAHHALRRLGGIAAGDRVLIHAASGGVGLAAVQIARRAGAEVFATAGSPEKRRFLHDLGIEHVMDSRALDFSGEILEATGGRGVRLVLNSLTGESIAKSLAAMGPEGHFLELGKTDLWDQARVSAVRPGVRFHPIALDAMMATVPEYVGALLRELLPEFERGELMPLRLKIYPLPEAVSAFRLMARAKHIGKVVITAPAAGEDQSRVPIRGDGAYLVTGGLGGLGLKFAKWLVDRGARHLVLTGRSAPAEATQRAIAELRVLGAHVDVVRSDVSRRDDVQRLLAAIPVPLRGVLHAAGVLDDGIVREQTRERFDKVMAAKVGGAIHLHELTLASPLDFFVMFSSAASVLGSPGQANYAAANAFLDALAHERRRRGLPALAINWGAWADVGMAADLDRAKGNRRETAGVERIDIERGLAAFGRLLETDEPQVAVLPIDWKKLLESLPPGMEPAWLESIAAANRAPKTDDPRSNLKARLAELTAGGHFEVVLEFVREQAAKVMGSDAANLPDPQRPLNELGFDSLMGVELCNALSNGVGQHLPPTMLFDYPTLEKLSHHLASTVLGLALPPAAVPAEPEPESLVLDRVLSDVKQMTEQEMDALVAEELEKT